MIHGPRRVAAALAPVLAAAATLAACGGGGDSDAGPAALTPFIAPSPYTTEEALKKLDEVELMVKVPDPELIQRYEISAAEVQKRTDLVLNGTSDTTGLDDARAALEAGNRILAAEYIHNVVTDYIQPFFGSNDADSIGEKQLDEIDPGHVFVRDHSLGMPVSGLLKRAAIALIELWYGVLPS